MEAAKKKAEIAKMLEIEERKEQIKEEEEKKKKLEAEAKKKEEAEAKKKLEEFKDIVEKENNEQDDE